MYIKVRAKTDQKSESLRVKSPTHFEISVKEKPQQNMANKRIIELIAMHFAILAESAAQSSTQNARKVRIVSGHHSPSKILSVDEGENVGHNAKKS